MNLSMRIGLLAFLAVTTEPALAEDAAGKWTGKISANGVELPVVLTLQKAPDGALSGYLESPTQTDQHIPIGPVSSDGKTLSFVSQAVMGRYEATWDDAKKAWAGIWSQSGADLSLDLARAK